MIKEGTIRYNQVTIEYCEKKNKSGSLLFAISQDKKIVSISSYDKKNNIIMVAHEGSQPIPINLNLVQLTSNPLLSYPTIEYMDIDEYDTAPLKPSELPRLYPIVEKNIPIKLKLWQFIIDNNLENVKIEFDGGEKEVSKITIFKKPSPAIFTTVFKIKAIVFQNSFGYNCVDQASSYSTEDYSTREEAENALFENEQNIAMNLEDQRQCYFVIEQVIKRKEYERETYNP